VPASKLTINNTEVIELTYSCGHKLLERVVCVENFKNVYQEMAKINKCRECQTAAKVHSLGMNILV
jgi:hypothetical protein